MKYFLPPWVTKAQLKSDEFALYNWKNGESVVLDDLNHPVYEFILNGDFPKKFDSEKYQADIDWLIEKNILTENIMLTPLREEKIIDNDLHLILLPAGEACNLDCVYCYEDHADSRRMGITHINSIIELCKKNDSKNVHVEYFGGEPLLNIKFIEQISDSLKSENISLFASVTTNGTLIDKNVLHKLYKANVKSFQITLDGTKETHNILRPSKSKVLNSFDATYKALKIIANSVYDDISVIIRINANHLLLEERTQHEFIKDIKDIIDQKDQRFTFLIKPIGDYASANFLTKANADGVYCKHNQASKTITTIESNLTKHGYRLADALFLATHQGYSCYAGNPKSYVIKPDFSVYKCTVAFNDPINKVGKLESNGTLSLNENFQLWTKDYSTESCSSCFLSETCQGNSCPLINIKSSSKCCPPIKYNSELATAKIINFINLSE